MGIDQILITGGLILIYRLLFGSRGRGWILFIASLLAVFWLQPPLPVRGLDFWLPLATLMLGLAGWLLTQPPGERGGRENWMAALAVAGVVIALGLTRYLGSQPWITASRPPGMEQVLPGLAAAGLVGLVLARFSRPLPSVLAAGLAVLILIFVVLKAPPLIQTASEMLRVWSGQAVERASVLDIRWLGFSYIAFRLIATLRDRQAGRLPHFNLREYMTYLVFFPTLTAGPIDRPERFVKDLRAEAPFNAAEAAAGGERLAVGLLRKFVIADGLAFFALDPSNVAAIRGAGWLWLALFAYSLRIYFDFAGYTDIAIGLARWLGVRLPENFNRPYLKPNLTQFWNNWHITLTQWFRAYYFNPLTRALRGRKPPLAAPLVILITQLTTMLLIGLWHGITWNFVLWGAWHGLGLYLHNRYAEASRGWLTRLEQRPQLKRGYTFAGGGLTFVFVSLGWVWFVLPDTLAAWSVLTRLFGLG